MHISRFGRKQQRGEDLLDDGSDRGKGQSGGATAHPLALDVRMRHGRQHDMVLPTGIRPSLEVIESKFGLEFLILLFDRPSLMRQHHEAAQPAAGRQMDQVVL